MDKAAILCNGPSRVSYQPSDEYKFVVGCNVPWTDCDATVVLDDAIIKLWHQDPLLIKTNVVYSERAWAAVEQYNNPMFLERCMEVRQVDDKQSHSSGHVAVEVAINRGFKQIDIYGCDAWFSTRNGDSFTRAYVPISSPNQELRMVSRMQGWKLRWQLLMENNPTVKLNFIK